MAQINNQMTMTGYQMDLTCSRLVKDLAALLRIGDYEGARNLQAKLDTCTNETYLLNAIIMWSRLC
jgi:hypothetical protein